MEIIPVSLDDIRNDYPINRPAFVRTGKANDTGVTEVDNWPFRTVAQETVREPCKMGQVTDEHGVLREVRKTICPDGRVIIGREAISIKYTVTDSDVMSYD
jgi:hypothetical protein